MRRCSSIILILWAILFACAHAQTGSDKESDAVSEETHPSVTFRSVPRNLLTDQKEIWSFPRRVNWNNSYWIVPTAGIIAGAVVTDRDVSRGLSRDPKTTSRWNSMSNAGLFAIAGGTGSLYLLGKMNDSGHLREAGILGSEAMANSLIVGEIIKRASRRQRPGEGNGNGEFGKGGSSFPSAHAMLAFSAASVIAHEFPGPLTKLLAYGGAAGVASSRVLALKHFPSDVLVGSLLGYLIGEQTYARHHSSDLPGDNIGTFEPEPKEPRKFNSLASPYVPIDSWIYPAIDRLSALGYVQSAFAGLRPWTRRECARLVGEASGSVNEDSPVSVRELLGQLEKECPTYTESGDNIEIQVNSLYSRLTGISGKPLADDYHFGSTVVNDYGRCVREGVSLVSGADGEGRLGPYAFYVRGEYQHAPSAPPLPQSARDAMVIQEYVTIPPAPGIPFRSVNTFHLLDAYISMALGDWQVSFGNQSLWWGPGASGPMMFSNNIAPIPMLRLDKTVPESLPGIFKYLGPYRVQTFVGQTSGQQFVSTSTGVVGNYQHQLSQQPFVHGAKLMFKPTPNFEFGVSRTAVFGGPNFPLTFDRLRTVLFSFSTSNRDRTDPGDRRAGFDFTYRVPGLRKWLVLYSDSLTEDEPNPVAYPRRSAFSPGIYLPQLPRIPKLDLRVESAYTDVPGMIPNGYFYWNLRYLNGYTKDNHLIGNWVGREGRALTINSKYSASATSNIQMQYRDLRVDTDSGRGGRQQNLGFALNGQFAPNLKFKVSAQYERWKFPALAVSTKSDVLASFQLSFEPRWRISR